MGGSSKSQVVGYKYYFGLHFGFCHGPVDAVRRINVSDKVAWPTGANDTPMGAIEDSGQFSIERALYENGRPPGSPLPTFPSVATNLITESGLIYINNPELFGGDQKEGGIQGYVRFHFGGRNEQPNEYLQRQLKGPVPAFRGILSAVAEQCHVASMNPYVKPWSVLVTRIFATSDGAPQWYPAMAAVGEKKLDMNPAHIIRECLTNKVWGKGYDDSEVDEFSFRYAAERLFQETFGLSIVWGDTRDVDSFIQNICAHIDGAIYQDRVTNVWRIKLVRDDYVLADTPIIDEDHILSVEDLGRAMPAELVNQVTLTYWNRDDEKNSVIVIDNTALQDSIGGRIIPNDVDRTAICDLALAQRVAAREMRSLGTSLLTGRIVVDRVGMTLNQGDVFRLSLGSRSFGLKEFEVWLVPVRVTSIDYGTAEDPGIGISFIEDVFALPETTYLAPTPSLWDDPRKPPQPSLYRYIGEIPYYSIVQALGAAQTAALSPTAGGVAVSGSRQTVDTSGMQAWIRQGGASFQPAGVFSAAATARIALAYPAEETTTVTVTEVVDPVSIYYGRYAAWDNELVLVLDYNHVAGTLMLGRGVLDTVPQPHASDSRIIFIDGAQYLHPEEYDEGETVEAKIVTQTGAGKLALSKAPTDSVTMKSRQVRPYAPGRFRIDGLPPQAAAIHVYGVGVNLSWAHRNRVQQTAYIVQQGEGNMTPEPDMTYGLDLFDPESKLIGTLQPPLVTSWNYGNADEVKLGAPQEFKFALYAKRDGYNSWQAQTQSVIRHGLGFQLGSELGGVKA